MEGGGGGAERPLHSADAAVRLQFYFPRARCERGARAVRAHLRLDGLQPFVHAQQPVALARRALLDPRLAWRRLVRWWARRQVGGRPGRRRGGGPPPAELSGDHVEAPALPALHPLRVLLAALQIHRALLTLELGILLPPYRCRRILPRPPRLSQRVPPPPRLCPRGFHVRRRPPAIRPNICHLPLMLLLPPRLVARDLFRPPRALLPPMRNHRLHRVAQFVDARRRMRLCRRDRGGGER